MRALKRGYGESASHKLTREAGTTVACGNVMPNLPNVACWIAWNRIKSVGAKTVKRRDAAGLRVVRRLARASEIGLKNQSFG